MYWLLILAIPIIVEIIFRVWHRCMYNEWYRVDPKISWGENYIIDHPF